MAAGNSRALFVAAHPDDADFLAGGTIAKLVKEGRETAYVVATNGNKGSSDPHANLAHLVALREAEQRDAARTLGVAHVIFLGYEDGELEDTRDLRRDITREIRRWRPDLVITLNPHRSYNNPPGWHRDHRVVARATLDCIYPLARDYFAFPELVPDHPPHTVREVYTVQWEQPNHVVDITETIDLKLAAIRCHPSQVEDMAAFQGRMWSRATELGKERGYAFAEGFDRIIVPG